MNIIISNSSQEPLYQQIKEQIKNAILREELSKGEMLPSIRNFANDINVSVLTIRRVYGELEEEGFVTSQAGVGTFVSASNLDLIRDAKYRLVEEQIQKIIKDARALNISKDELKEMMNILFEED
ncbi:MAG: GntR family transcriptional regulator [Eubacteriales bacterium]|nr:GntR family transcriptional regulator [Eubacteriales bacterium]MDY3332643.1 GntR family transcriptional regulator [Gallibacter sp.]